MHDGKPAALFNQANDRKNFVTFLVNKKDYHEIVWLGKKEFRYRGEWYDVVSHRENDEGFLFTCYHDKREEEASAGLNRFVDSRTNEITSVVI
jgi:hypothetical protein